MKFNILLSFLILIISISFLTAQTWTAIDEVETETEFNQIQADFENFWKGKEIPKGAGYKPFKRWEYRWGDRIEANGQIPEAGRKYELFNEFLSKNAASKSSSSGPWQSLGPDENTSGYAGTGRIMSIGFHPSNSNIIYVGSAGGGLWKSTDGGTSWTPKTDFLGSLGVSGICVDPATPNTIYIATGDGDASDNYSIGVLKSTDGGNNWSTTGLDWATSNTDVIRNMIMDPNDNQVLMVATNIGIYRTTNGGVSWVREQTGNFYDIEMNPDASTNTFYAVDNNNIYISTDNGDSWTKGYQVSNSNRLSIATTADDPDYIYLLSSGNGNGANGSSGYNGVYRSTNAGSTFSVMSTSPNILGYELDGMSSGGQGWYDLVIAADPNNKSTIYIGGVNNWKSTNSGTSWTITSHWYGAGGTNSVHADKHLLEFRGSVLWEGNDGGIYKTTDGGNTWQDKTSNLVISQMYRIGVSEMDIKVIAGLQDNGTKLRKTNQDWDDVLGGDGMDCSIHPLNSNIIYGESQFGNIHRSTNGGANFSFISNGLPDGAWVTPHMVHPEQENTVYAGFHKVLKSTNNGTTWDSLGIFNGNNMTLMEISTNNPDYIYTYNSSRLWSTSDGGANWNEVSSPGSISSLSISPSSPLTLYATRTSYSSNQQVWKSVNGGIDWVSISENLPSIPANSVTVHNDGNETVYVGMDVGVYYRTADNDQWTLYNMALPNVEIKEIEIKESANELYLATYGRGVWKNASISPTFSACDFPQALQVSDIEGESFTVSWQAPTPAPNSYEWVVTNSINPPASGETTTELTKIVTGLNQATLYYFHIRSNCGGSNSGWVTISAKTVIGCGSLVYDSGGENGDYSDNENIIYKLCPSAGNTDLTITFSLLDIEPDYDALYVFNGDDTSHPLFPGGVTTMNNSFPIGGFNGNSIPGPFTSTDDSGCITLQFLSDVSVTEAGFALEIVCAETCSSTVNKLDDNGFGSLRDAIECLQNGGEVIIDPSISGQTISLSSTIEIDKDIKIIPTNANPITIEVVGNGPIFNVFLEKKLELNGVSLISGERMNGAAIINNGILKLTDVTVKENESNSNPTSLIENNGNISVSESTNIIEEE